MQMEFEIPVRRNGTDNFRSVGLSLLANPQPPLALNMVTNKEVN